MYVPAAHAAHTPPSGPVKPGSHTHAVASLLPPGDDELSPQECMLPSLHHNPSTHPVQFDDPGAPEYVPFGHGRHPPLPVSGLYWPLPHAARAGLRVEG